MTMAMVTSCCLIKSFVFYAWARSEKSSPPSDENAMFLIRKIPMSHQRLSIRRK